MGTSHLELQAYYPNLKMGKYFHVVGSMHVYKKYYDMIKNVVVDKDNNLNMHMPKISDLKEIKKLQYNENIIRNDEKKKLKNLNDDFCNWCQDVLLNKTIN